MRTSEDRSETVRALKALASPIRLQVLTWLKDPKANFPAQVDGDFVEDGVCADFLRDKLDLAASTTSRHLSVLTDAGFLVATRKKGWTFYRRNESRIDGFVEDLRDGL
ncbi:ArsR/SmtB family transcription factor [Kribbella sp. NPDC051586]|uniref:ArsR/SmtB family transcription factor n=1 Tax=Kribbella sp. NPDC051586 TaxID=3364118 RepID=UPI0037A00548